MSYPSDLKDREWETIWHHFELSNGYKNRCKHSIREILKAILYIVKTGFQWRQLPNDFPNWKTVYTYYRRLCLKGTWEHVLDDLNQLSRKKSGHSPSPSYAIIDAQSVKMVSSGDQRGIDDRKKNQRKKTSHRC